MWGREAIGRQSVERMQLALARGRGGVCRAPTWNGGLGRSNWGWLPLPTVHTKTGATQRVRCGGEEKVMACGHVEFLWNSIPGEMPNSMLQIWDFLLRREIRAANGDAELPVCARRMVFPISYKVELFVWDMECGGTQEPPGQRFWLWTAQDSRGRHLHRLCCVTQQPRLKKNKNKKNLWDTQNWATR